MFMTHQIGINQTFHINKLDQFIKDIPLSITHNNVQLVVAHYRLGDNNNWAQSNNRYRQIFVAGQTIFC